MAVVSLNANLRRIQGEIAEMLQLNLGNGSLFQRAQVLHARMSQDSRRLLVVLANVRDMPDLEAIGIPYGDTNTNGRCKIMLTSGLMNVPASVEMRAQRPIAFESRNSILRGVMEALADDQINPIVICGKGGIGKTTLVKEVGQRAKAWRLYDEVVMAVFTPNLDFKCIQDQIADCLGLSLAGQPLSARANSLCRRLSGDKRVLLILDNVSMPLNLEEIGIPLSCDKKGCKILVSSRNEDIFSGTKKIFSVGVLLEQEAWSLFREMAGSSIESPELLPVAQQVLRECAGLPIAIATVGRALHQKSRKVWIDALRQLRKPCPANIPGMMQEVYRKIELSYECLGSKEAKTFFLLCCLPESNINIRVEDLVESGIRVELFKGIGSETEAWNCVETLVDILKSCLLLLDGDKERFVKVPDIVRSVGLSIAASKWG
ncbi:PREDICTED: disease resistance [Prunus dulcis]|uniref:PREDICTED: disease resistance n=1 Tax=Prunus dulcis TaxID=3755 RepID=A0A5E4FSW4_PRUDU|nr:PREDICTED: disease resistance [Prunus dulcis]